jgi:FkbM family methyltransferase
MGHPSAVLVLDRVRNSLRERRELRRHAGHRLLRELAEQAPDPFFVEVGAGDGVTADHLWPFTSARGWAGILVEPVPYVFERLREAYAGNDRVVLENVAIADHDGTLPFFHLADPAGLDGAPAQHHLLGTSSRELLSAHEAIPERDELIVETTVPCIRFETLCRRHDVRRIDVLVLDAEGQDCAILAGVDLEALRPRVVCYEDVHVPAGEQAACLERLRGLGYETMQEGFDTWCVDARPDDELTAAWRGILDAGPAVPREELDRWFASAGS